MLGDKSPTSPMWTISNRMEILADQLVDQWRENPDPWQIRRVIVPSRAIERWLQHYLAKSLGVCANVEWLKPSALIQTLSDDCSISAVDQLPSLQDLTVTLYGTLKTELAGIDAAESPTWRDIAGALRCQKGQIVDEERLLHFSQLLARIFQRYSEFGAQAVRPMFDEVADRSWQAHLWRAAFGTAGPWRSISSVSARVCQELAGRGQMEKGSPFARGQQRLDLFGLRFLSNSQWQLLQKASAHWQIEVFALSPCRYYWSDVRSSRESKRLLRWIASQGASASTLESFEETLRRTHPLLASLGKVGRRFVEKSELSGSGAQVKENYALSKELASLPTYEVLWQQDLIQVKGGCSLLERLQADMLLMREPVKTESSSDRACSDGTVQVHCAPTKLREVEIALALIQRALACDATLAPSDILLVAPSLEEYRTLLQSTFAAGDGQLDCQTLHAPEAKFGGFWQSLNQLLQMCQNGWGSEELCNALTNPTICRSIDLNPQEVRLLTDLFQKGHVEWGLDADHRARFLTKGAKRNSGGHLQTWRAFHAALLQGLAHREDDRALARAQLDPTLPEPLIVENLASCADALKKWFHWFEKCTQLLMPFSDGTSRPLTEWAELFIEIADAIFPSIALGDKEKKALFKWCRQWRKRAEVAPNFAKLAGTTMQSSSAVALLRDAMGESSALGALRSQAVRLATFASGAVPARIILLLGAGEGAIPQAEQRQPFEIGIAGGMEFSPAQSDEDRSLFLELLLAARQKLYITYSRAAAADDDPTDAAEPCLLVAELLNALANTIGDLDISSPRSPFESFAKGHTAHLHCVHPDDGFDARYFTIDTSFPQFGQIPYGQALAGWQRDAISPLFLPTLRPAHAAVERAPLTVAKALTLRDLGKALSHPLEFYLSKSCGISLWQLAPPKRAWLLQKRAIWQLLKKRALGHLAADDLKAGSNTHLIARINCAKLEAEEETLQGLLQNSDERPQVGFEVRFSAGIAKPCQTGPANWLLPALRVCVAGQYTAIEGEFDESSWLGPWGLALPRIPNRSAGHFAKFCSSLPSILAHFLSAPVVGSARKVHLGGICWDISECDAAGMLGELAAFATAAAATPLPLLPEWIELLESKDGDKLTKLLTDALAAKGSFGDNSHTLRWIFGQEFDPGLSAFWIECYHQRWMENLAPLLRRVRQMWREIPKCRS